MPRRSSQLGLGPMVVISIGADFATPTMLAPQLYVLDMVPELNGLADLTNMGLRTPGQSYSDPAGGLTITLVTISEQGATINVTTTATGGNVCAGGTRFTAPGPENPSCMPLTGTDGGAPATGGASGTNATGGQAGDTGGAAGTGGAVGAGETGGSPGSGGAMLSGSGGRSAAASGGGTGSAGVTAVAGSGGGPPHANGGNSAVAVGGPGGGCSCNAAPTSGPTAKWSWLIAAAAAFAGRRRSRRRADHVGRLWL